MENAQAVNRYWSANGMDLVTKTLRVAIGRGDVRDLADVTSLLDALDLQRVENRHEAMLELFGQAEAVAWKHRELTRLGAA